MALKVKVYCFAVQLAVKVTVPDVLRRFLKYSAPFVLEALIFVVPFHDVVGLLPVPYTAVDVVKLDALQPAKS